MKTLDELFIDLMQTLPAGRQALMDANKR